MTYRGDLNSVTREVPFTLKKVLWVGALVIAVLAVLGFAAQSLGIISMNIDREIVQHSQQYIETKVGLLNGLYDDYLQIDADITEFEAFEGNESIVTAKAAQQKNLVKRIRTESALVPASQVPDSISTFLSLHTR